MILGNIEAELFRRIIKVGGHRNIGDRRFVADQILATAQPLVDDRKVVVDASFQERKDSRIALRFGKAFQKTEWTQKSVDLLIVEDDPAQCF